MKFWSFYRLEDGIFSGRQFVSTLGKRGLLDHLAANTPAGCAAIEGRYDRFRQRVDLTTGRVVEDESLGAARDQEQRRNQALQQIDELQRNQLRAVTELIANPGDAEARKHFDARQEQIAKLRTQL